MSLLRGIAAFALVLASGLALLVALLPTDTQGTRRSLLDQQTMHADMIKMGRFTEDLRRDRGRLPDREELLGWMAKQDFEYVGFQRASENPGAGYVALSVLPTGEEFIVGEKSVLPEDGHTYRIAYWNNWTEEYAPETGANTFASSISDYAPPFWERLLGIVIAVALAVLAVRVFRRSPRPKESIA